MESILRHITSLYCVLLDLLLPERCIGCRASGEILCGRCVLNIRRAERETENDIYACFDYRDPLIKRAIWNLKYYNRKNLGKKLGSLLSETLLEEIADMELYRGTQPIYVIPVPLSRARIKTRGYNQAEVIACHFCNSLENNVLELKTSIVAKKTDTLPQARIANRAERLRNIRGAFEIKNPESVRGQTFIVIDDVTTTGGTITEIMKILKKSGAEKVIGFAIAH